MFSQLWFRWLTPKSSRSSSSRKKPSRKRYRPSLESLEDRAVPASFTGFDINPDTDEFGGPDSEPRYMTNSGGVVFFAAHDGVHGYELWKSDPRPGGVTVLVKDINPGIGSSFQDMPSYEATLCDVNGTLFFVADDGTNGYELWKSDGTTAGTVMVKDFIAGAGSSSLHSFTNVNGMLFFGADDGVNGSELWKSDGTAAGTVMVKDIYIGTGSSVPSTLTNLNGTWLFAAADDFNQSDVWKTDGTAAGTVKVKDFNGPTTWAAWDFGKSAVCNGAIYFVVGNDGQSEIWKTDGTEAGTALVKNLGASTNGAYELTTVGNVVFFGVAGGDLWKSDGTEAGTVVVKATIGAAQLIAANGKLYFTADPPNDDPNYGNELWRSDGTAGGTGMVADLYEGPSSSLIEDLVYVEATKTLYFTALVSNEFVFGRTIVALDTMTGVITTPSYGIVEPAQTTGGQLTYVPGLPGEPGYLFFQGLGDNGWELWRMNL